MRDHQARIFAEDLHPLAPSTPAFADEGEHRLSSPALSPAVDAVPRVPGVPVAFDHDLTPLDSQGRFVAHHRDEEGTVHFFAVTERQPDSPAPDAVSHELRYVRARQVAHDVVHDSLPVMPVSDPQTSPWPLPALEYYLEAGDLPEVQDLARDTARIFDLPFPDRLPELSTPEPQITDTGWSHFDAALVLAEPQGVDDGFSVGVVDVYAHHEQDRWAARFLPLGEFDTLDEALDYQQQALLSRIAEDRGTALSSAGFNHSPAIYERIARAEADAALVDLLEQHDGHLPPDFDGDHEPVWEPLTSKEWDAYRDHVRWVTLAVPEADPARSALPTATPRFANDALIAASQQPEAPYLLAEAPEVAVLAPQDSVPAWRLDIVPARDPDGAPLGYSAVCVVDFGELAETLSPDAPQRAQWLEVAQFQTEDRAQQFRADFMSLVGSDELSGITGPVLASVISDDLEMDSRWQVMDKQTLEQLKAEEWLLVHDSANWHPSLKSTNADRDPETTLPTLDL